MPVISPRPFGMRPWMTGAENTRPSSTIARRRPMLFPVTREKVRAPSSVVVKPTDATPMLPMSLPEPVCGKASASTAPVSSGCAFM